MARGERREFRFPGLLKMIGVGSAATLINSAVGMSGTCLQKRIWVRAFLLGLRLHIHRRRLPLPSEAETEKIFRQKRQAIHYQMQASFIRLDLPEYFRLNQAIHKRIVEAAGNPVLTQTHENLNARLLRARYLASQTDRDRWAAAMREHELIIDALGRRAAEELAELLREHLWHKYDAIETNFDRV
jgi:DNA-binding GntR family transcriptional regulator